MSTVANRSEFILYSVGQTYLMLRNTYPDPMSFKDNVAQEIWAAADTQRERLVEFYKEQVLGQTSLATKETGRAEMLDAIFGDEFFSSEVIDSLTIHAIQHVGNWWIFGSGTDSAEFKSMVLEDEELHDVSPLSVVTTYEAYFLPSELFPHVFDINKLFRGYTRWDYDTSEWVTE